jgi:hypothetical protein
MMGSTSETTILGSRPFPECSDGSTPVRPNAAVTPGATGSFRSYAGELDDLGPFGDFLPNKNAEFGRRAPHRRVAQIGQRRL